MLYLEENTLFMKNVVSGISSECFMKGVNVPPRGVELLIKNTLLNPDLNFSYNPETRKEELTRLADACVGILCGKDKGLRKLYELQGVFHSEYSSDEHILREYESLKSLYLEPLLKKIVSTVPSENKEFNELYKLVVTYTMLLTGMGDPRERDVFKEYRDALASIFSYNDLATMIGEGVNEKNKMLQEVAYVTAGILLYNKIKNKGGLGIENYPCILADSLDSLATIFVLHIQYAQEIATAATRLVTNQIYWCHTKDGYETLVFEKPVHLNDEEFNFVFWMSLVQQQVVSYMRRLYFNIAHYSEMFENWQEGFMSTAKKIDEVVSNRIAVPTKIIYPLFMELYDKWRIFYTGIVVVSVYEKVWSLISEYLIFKNVPEKVKSLLSKSGNKTHSSDHWLKAKERFNLSDDEFQQLLAAMKIDNLEEDFYVSEPDDEEVVEMIDPEKVKCSVIHPAKEEMDNYDLMFGGFDPVYLLESNGVVAGISAGIGYLVHDNKYFGFKEVKCAYKFGADPEKYYRKVIDFVRRNPHYIDILQLRGFMDKFRGRAAFTETLILSKPISDKDVQTELHPVPTYIDDNYIHSIWQARANYCSKLSISLKRTRFCQTSLSYMTTTISNQTYPLKDHGMQTMQDKWLNTSLPQVYRYGLRGKPDAQYHEVSLTLPVEEPHQRIIRPTPGPTKKDAGAQTEEYEYFDTCLKLKIDPHPPMFYMW